MRLVARALLIGVASLVVAMAAEARPNDIVLPTPRSVARPSAVTRGAHPLPEANTCGPTTLACNTTVLGRLASGDCLRADGTLFDEYLFDSTSSQLVKVTVRPLTGLFTNAWITLVAPPTDNIVPPLLSGGAAATLSYILTSSGKWRVQAGTNDVFASGEYALDITCKENPDPFQRQGCVEQEILCGQSATWSLTSESCHSASDPNRVYTLYRIYGVAGDTFNITLKSTAFDPMFAIYDFQTSAIAEAQSAPLPMHPDTDVLTFTIPRNDIYDILVTSNNAQGAGQYTLTVNCTSSGCLEPIFTQQPQDVVVPMFANAPLSASATALGDIDYEWFDADGAQPNVGSGPRITTAPVTASHTYYVVVTTPCGSRTSRLVHVTLATPPPPPPPRHRAARH